MEFGAIRDRLSGRTLKKKELADHDLGNMIIAYAQFLAKQTRAQSAFVSPDSEEFEHLSELQSGLDRFRWSFPLRLRKVPAERCNRCNPMLNGPIFTSDKYPWPDRDGRYQEPVVQIDLKETGLIGGVELGEGMLQLWVGPGFEDSLLRIIPTPDVVPDLLSPVPPRICPNYFELAAFSAGFSSAWPSVHDGCHVQEIVGTKSKLLSWPSWLSLADDGGELEFIRGTEFYASLMKLVDILPPNSPDDNHHLFGNFRAIQYRVDDVDATLLGLDSQTPFYWGDGGNAQISYHYQSNGEIEFGFLWGSY